MSDSELSQWTAVEARVLRVLGSAAAKAARNTDRLRTWGSFLTLVREEDADWSYEDEFTLHLRSRTEDTVSDPGQEIHHAPDASTFEASEPAPDLAMSGSSREGRCQAFLAADVALVQFSSTTRTAGPSAEQASDRIALHSAHAGTTCRSNSPPRKRQKSCGDHGVCSDAEIRTGGALAVENDRIQSIRRNRAVDGDANPPTRQGYIAETVRLGPNDDDISDDAAPGGVNELVEDEEDDDDSDDSDGDASGSGSDNSDESSTSSGASGLRRMRARIQGCKRHMQLLQQQRNSTSGPPGSMCTNSRQSTIHVRGESDSAQAVVPRAPQDKCAANQTNCL